MKHSVLRCTLGVGLAVALASCGGGGGGTAPPIAAPPPATPPSPPSPPVVTYANAFDFTRDFFYESQMAEVTVVETYNAASPRFYDVTSATALLQRSFTAARITYEAATRSAAITIGAETTRFAAADLLNSTPDILRYLRQSTAALQYEEFRYSRFQSGINYLAGNNQSLELNEVTGNNPRTITRRDRYFLLGLPTAPIDLPAAGNPSFVATLEGATAIGNSRTGLFDRKSLALDFGTGRVTGAFVLPAPSGSNSATVTVRFDGTLDRADNRIEGRITSPDSAYTGNFTGRLFGPRGIELGLIFTLSDGNRGVAGQVIAVQG